MSAPPLEIAYSQADVRLGLFLTHRLSIDRDSSKERSQPEEEVRDEGTRTCFLPLLPGCQGVERAWERGGNEEDRPRLPMLQR